MSEYFLKLKSLWAKVKVKLDLSNRSWYNINVDKLEINKLKNVPHGLVSLKS